MQGAILVIFLLLVIAFVWISGDAIFKAPSGPEISPSSGGSEIISPADDGQKPAEEKIEINLYRGNASWSNDPKEEYIEIQAGYYNTKAVNISGWKLKDKDGKEYVIPKGTGLAYSARVNPEENILLEPAKKAVILTGKSPINANFLLNKCVGYFSQFNEFYPSLPQNCPDPEDETGVSAQKDACFLYLKTLPSCRMPQAGLPLELDDNCRLFIGERVNYAGCVDAHKNDNDFFDDEWRIYLEQNKEIWSNVRETIRIFDQNGSLIAETSY